ncbi:acyl-CoA dehydrogenase [Geobacter metallireducens GS-15]|uniref:Acyl-CoA dehydrogenase n=1 Tax=Geobacter metallireducens (strain ATCC 53774 / DSM 7210 / GS-15) TaxID=269799 RepID=Q39TI6_GEOMG|nr:acyl-CoA dehydrogenase [Geobacter metallireducens]ABB32438.1 acyl-CoA dehydrogenase [Geobacter metallireducens GS-15]
MANLLVDERDVKFALFEQLKVQDLCASDRFSGWNEKVLGLLLSEASKFAEKVLFPLNIEGDKVGARFEGGEVYSVPGTAEAYQSFVENGWLTACEEETLGGQGLPHVIKNAAHEMFFAANFPFMCYVNLTHDAAKLIELFGSEQQKSQYLHKMYGGEWLGTMALTEPAAGSDVGNIEFKATRNTDGTYSLVGQKIFITNGDSDVCENTVHMVLARIEGDPAGTKGLSIFIVPKFKINSDGSLGEANDVKCIGIEHKMGIKASPTTTMSFGEKGCCTGYLLGKEQDGIKIMFHMMNASRLEVGMWGQGTCSVSYMHALRYALERRQGQSIADPDSGQVPIIHHPDIRRTLLMMKSYIQGMRAMLYYCGYAMDRMAVVDNEEEKKKLQGIVDLLIPLCKAYPTEKGVEFASHAIQVYGGYGYTQEYPVEQFMRDSKVACIFEGTTGIQAMDLALRKIRMKKGQVFAEFLKDMDGMVNRAAELPGLKKHIEQFERTKSALAGIPAHLAEGAEANGVHYSYLKATPFLEAFGDVVVAWFLLWGAVVAHGQLEELFLKKKLEDAESRKSFIQKNTDAAFLDGKIRSAQFFIGNILPVTDGKIAALAWGDVSAWEAVDKSF